MAGRRADSVVATTYRRRPPGAALRSLPSGFRRCEIDWHVCAHNNRLPLAEGHNGGIPSVLPISENPSGVTKKALQLSYLLPRVHLLLSLQVTAGLEAKVLCFSSDLFS